MSRPKIVVDDVTAGVALLRDSVIIGGMEKKVSENEEAGEKLSDLSVAVQEGLESGIAESFSLDAYVNELKADRR